MPRVGSPPHLGCTIPVDKLSAYTVKWRFSWMTVCVTLLTKMYPFSSILILIVLGLLCGNDCG